MVELGGAALCERLHNRLIPDEPEVLQLGVNQRGVRAQLIPARVNTRIVRELIAEVADPMKVDRVH